jgi:XTP/dITP diphosphohydrolase
LADDSGLEVDVLDGAPGVYSARYAGEHCSYADNNEKLLHELAKKSDRTACFRTAIALSDPDGNVQTVEGACSGVIIEELRGTHGFGYDPLFIPEGYSETFAEIGSEIKNRISHRAKALKKAHEAWSETLQAL